VGELLDRHGVTWVNTIGMRTPRLDLATVRRGWEKVRHWTRPPEPREPLPANLRVVNPTMLPWFGNALGRWANRRLLVRQLAPLLRALPELPVAVTTIPIVADLVGLLPVRRWVYYCVDDFGLWPGLDQTTLQRMEARLLERADSAIAVSEVLQEKLRRMGRAAPLLTHGVDLDFWADPAPGVAPARLEGLPRPLIAFWGVVDRRMDLAFLRRLAGDLGQGTVVLAGPEADPDPTLDAVAGVVRLGPLPFAQLPCLARAASVLVMPYGDLPVTRAIQPLKLKEYLATGKPVVVRDLPANRVWADCLDLADSPEAFSQAVRLRLQTGLLPQQREARLRLAAESWAVKAREFERWALGPDAAAAVGAARRGA
jgi:glycosyltransferase involved in cell wall biosynthesis